MRFQCYNKNTYLFVNAVWKPTVDTFPSVDGGIATEKNAKIQAKGEEG